MNEVLANKMVNKDVFQVVIQQVWKTLNGVKIELVGNNRFLFRFNFESDRRRILVNGPYYFDKSLIVLSKPKGVWDPSKRIFLILSSKFRFIMSSYYV